jgi:ABC-type Co2+ transport system, permease component
LTAEVKKASGEYQIINNIKGRTRIRYTDDKNIAGISVSGFLFLSGEISMHIPDNYLSPSTCMAMTAAMAPVWAISVKKVKNEVSKSKMPLLGIGAAFSFLMMMFNVPLPGGTTGHAVGGTLLGALLGPWAACIAVSVALLLQALLFGDGGILAFGANAFNMAFVLPFTGYFIYKLIKDRTKSQTGECIALGAGAYCGINAAALFAAVEFGIQPLLFHNAAGQALYCPYPLSVSVPAMTIPHLLVAGPVEVIFTIVIYAFVRKTSPGTVYDGKKLSFRPLAIFAAVLVCLTPLGLLAAGTAWGEWGTDEISKVVNGGAALGYTPGGMSRGFQWSAVMPDYSVSGMPEAVGYILSAAAGAAILVIIFKLISNMKKGDNGKSRNAV